MTDYSKMNDRDIDRLVLKVIYGVHADDKDIQGCWSRGGFKYTTNPTDAMPIIDDNEIALLPSTDFGWVAISGLMLNGCSSYIDQRLDSCFQHSNTNPLRAAMIVFLQMQENNHD